MYTNKFNIRTYSDGMVDVLFFNGDGKEERETGAVSLNREGAKMLAEQLVKNLKDSEGGQKP